MFRNTLISTAVLMIFLITNSYARASFAAVPLEILIDEADLVVEGKVVQIKNAGFAKGAGNFKRPYEAAIVQVSRVMGSMKVVKQVRIAQPSRGGGIAVSTDIRFRVGQQGIWMLNWDAERKIYWALHPSQFQSAANSKKIVKLVQRRAKIKGGKSVRGLVARAEVFVKGDLYEVRFSLKNVSTKSVAICTHFGQQPLKVKWIGPGGKAQKSNHYLWLARARFRAPSKADFITIPPNGVRYVGPRGKYQGVLFSTKAQREINQCASGRHALSITYVNQMDGKRFGVSNAFVGQVQSNEVALMVK